ncbi:hypothetical protein [Sphingomonas sp. PR090111-T3T-6A]|uniref:hypothetical protein n=1 Tax=Sphingomonas sp. PR090111-T3T-6A TaxID=685778 RepID=UPI00036B3C95|nr:hypothetical protein [Sphingomonas sp. PR090111-T3T-6A]
MATEKKSKSGYYRVTLARKFEHEEYLYRPSHDAIVVDQGLYDEMKAAGVIDSVEHA